MEGTCSHSMLARIGCNLLVIFVELSHYMSTQHELFQLVCLSGVVQSSATLYGGGRGR